MLIRLISLLSAFPILCCFCLLPCQLEPITCLLYHLPMMLLFCCFSPPVVSHLSGTPGLVIHPPSPQRRLVLSPSPPNLKGSIMSAPEAGTIAIDFGKHKGKTLESLPIEYLRWMATSLHGERWSRWAELAQEMLKQVGSSHSDGQHEMGLVADGHCSPAGNLNEMLKQVGNNHSDEQHEMGLGADGHCSPNNLNEMLKEERNSHSDEQHEMDLAASGHCSPGKLNEIFCQLGPDTDVDTYASLLRHCTTEKVLSNGERVHEHMIRHGFTDDRFLNNLLLQMYGKCGSLQHAQAVFDDMSYRNVYSWTMMLAACADNGTLEHVRTVFAEMPSRNLVSWNSMISVCTQKGHNEEALQLLDQMQAEGFEPNKITLICILDACSSTADLRRGQEIHMCLVDNGWESDIVVGTALVDMYGKCGNLDDATAVFGEMPQQNVVSWSAMIAASAQNGHGKESLQLFVEMQAKGFEPNKVTFICILDACAKMAALDDGRDIHASVVARGCESDVVVGNALVSMYSKCGRPDDARAVFVGMPQCDVVLWNATITACAHNGNDEEALQLFSEMQSESIEPNKITFMCALDACASMAALEEGRNVHASIVADGWESDVAMGNTLVNMYSKCGSLDDARAVLIGMPRRNVVSWSALIAGCAQNGHSNAAIQLFDQMQAESIEPDVITFICILDACANVAALEQGRDIHASVVMIQWEFDIVVGNALINMYGKCGSLNDVRAVFEEMPQRDVISWSAMIAAYVQDGHFKEALKLFVEMQAESIKPDVITFVCILDACANAAALEAGQEVHASVIDNEWESDVAVGNALLNMYGKSGSLNDARAVFTEMPHRNVVSWNSMIAVCAQNGWGKEAVQLFHQMQDENIEPNEISFICILTACSHVGLVADGRQYFTSMSLDHGILPSVDHYVCMIDILGRAGQLEKAEQLIRSMPFEPITSGWLSLLSSCRIHGDVELGMWAANHVLNFDEDNSSSYVLLANIHAAEGMG